MSWLSRLPARTRVAASFAVVIAGLLAIVGVAVYTSMSSALLDELDTGLRSRAAAFDVLAPASPALAGLQEPGEQFTELLSADGRVLQASPGLPRKALLDRHQLAAITVPTSLTRRLSGFAGQARLLAVPLPSGGTLVVGASMADRADALATLAGVFWVAGPLGLAVASLAGWFVAGKGLRPVEVMRRQAAAITASGLDRRLELPPARDELFRLAVTLNDLLGRLEDALERDRLFLARAGHELRTPLTALKAELDLAADGPQDPLALGRAVESAREETDRLVRLANDLLALARTRDGRLPIRRAACPLRQLLDAAAAASRARAGSHGIRLVTDAPDCMVRIDALRVRQALDDLLDNSLRHTPAGGTITLTGHLRDGSIEIGVRDSGPGFAELHRHHSALTTGPPGNDGGGLGLRIAAAVATSHGGGLYLDNDPGGGAVSTLVLAVEEAAAREPGGCSDSHGRPISA